MSDMFNEWLMSTRVLQRQSFGADPANLEGEELVEYLRWNALACTDEQHEALAEVHWKPWGKAEPGFKNRDAFVDELVDVLHFVANQLVAARCSDKELTQRYEAKQAKNRARMASGTYHGHAEKCRLCGRALDDAAVKCSRVDSLNWYCAEKRTGAGGSSSSAPGITIYSNQSLGTANPYRATFSTGSGNGGVTGFGGGGGGGEITFTTSAGFAGFSAADFPPPADFNDDDDEGESGVLV